MRPLTPRSEPRPSLAVSLIPAVCLIGLLFVSIAVLESTGHVPLIAAAAVAGLVSVWILKQPWETVEQGLIESIKSALPAILILMAVGLLIGSWIASGVVPLLIYYGLKILAPSYFLAASCLSCGLISLATGSSWSTAATLGLALIGVGQALGVDPGMTAGAVVSGAYFGDKLSPLSDTTNLAAGAAGADLFEHIRHMLWTTLPALGLSLALYLWLGLRSGAEAPIEGGGYQQMLGALESGFDLSPWLLLAPATVLTLVARRTRPLPALLAGAAVGSALLLIFQSRNAPAGLASVIDVLYQGFTSHTGVTAVDELLSRGGLTSMMDTIALILCAFSFGGVMEASGMLRTLTEAMLKAAKSTSALIAATVATGMGLNVLAADQYLAVVLPGRMYKDAYAERGLAAKNLSRAVEDSATMTSPLVPWNTCGAYMAGVLGVATVAYAPYAFLNLASPVISLLYGLTGATIAPSEPRRDDGGAPRGANKN